MEIALRSGISSARSPTTPPSLDNTSGPDPVSFRRVKIFLSIARTLAQKDAGTTTAVIALGAPPTYDIPAMNISFIIDFLETERIPVDSLSVGGSLPRRVHLFPATFRVLMSYAHTNGASITRRENAYAHRLLEQANTCGKPILV